MPWPIPLRRARVSCAVYEAQPNWAEGSARAPRSRTVLTLRQLLTGLEGQVHFGKEFTRYDQQADGTVTALFADGSSASGQVLVAADGAHSTVRAQYLPQAMPEAHGLTEPRPAWRSSNITLVGDAIRSGSPRADRRLAGTAR